MSCKHNKAGCTETKDLDGIILHEEDCLFRSIKCLVVDCKADTTLIELENHMAEKHQDMKDGTWVFIKSQSDIGLEEMAKLMVAGAKVVRGKDWLPSWNHDGNPPGPGTVIGPTPRRDLQGCVDVKWGTGTTFTCRNGYEGKYEIKLAKTVEFTVCIRTWRHSDVRFFATLFLGSDDFWHIMVSAACGKSKAAKFRAEIRLASSNVPECSNVYHRPVEHLESKVDLSSMKKYTACLDVHKEVVEKQTGGKVANLQIDPEDIPFTCQVYEKVFVTFNKEDIEEKEE